MIVHAAIIIKLDVPDDITNVNNAKNRVRNEYTALINGHQGISAPLESADPEVTNFMFLVKGEVQV